MFNNVNGSDGVAGRQVQQKSLLELINSKKLQQNNPYTGFAVSDQTEISDEAISLFSKEQEIEYFKSMLAKEPEVDQDRVEAIKAQYESGSYSLPSDSDLADMLLGNSDFSKFMEL